VVDFTSPAYWYGASLAVRKGNPKGIHGMNDLAGKVAGAVGSGFDWYILSTHKELKELKSYPNTEAEFADLVNGRLNVVMEDENRGQVVHEAPSRSTNGARDWVQPVA
jgi:ABC-type amino acid transport substrate-binding protein